MARIRTFEQRPAAAGRSHTDVVCGWHVADVHGEVLVQLNTYGSADRKFEGASSQSIQIDRTVAAELIRVLRTTFPDLA